MAMTETAVAAHRAASAAMGERASSAAASIFREGRDGGL